MRSPGLPPGQLTGCMRSPGWSYWDLDDAEDAVQEALVRAWRELPRLREPGPLRRVDPAAPGECVP